MGEDKLSTLADVARLLGVPPHRIVYLLTTGKVPEPTTRLGNRRAFSAADIARIQQALVKKEAHE